jgi:hypothetical protein
MRNVPQFTLRQLLAAVLVVCVLAAFSIHESIGVLASIGIGASVISRQLASMVGQHRLWLLICSFSGSTLSMYVALTLAVQRAQVLAADPGIMLMSTAIVGVVVTAFVELGALAFRSLG